jgi:radical SAM superfamily enzyme YgiQ (UPF0313 family)
MYDKSRIALIDPQKNYESAYIPTGLCYLSSYLKKYSKTKIEIKIFNVPYDSLNNVLDFQPNIIGITSFTHTFNLACKMADFLKKNDPSVKLIIGGQHISMASWSMPKVFDFGVLGEGEETFFQLVNALILEKNGKINNLTGIQYWENNQLVVLPKTPPIDPLDNIPFPDREIIDGIEKIITFDNFRKFHRTGLRSMQVTTSRGCPYKCKFCQPSYLWGKFRMHSAEYTAEEIDYIHSKFKINAIMIEDDLFTGSKKRIARLIDELSKKNLIGKIIYHAGARTVQIDKEWIELLKQLGVVTVEFGIESGSDEIAKYLKRGITTTEINKRAIHLLNEANIGVHASFIVGSPPETKKDLNQTMNIIKWIRKKHKNNTCGICIATALPGTGLWDYALESNLIDKTNINWDKLSSLESIPSDEKNLIYLNKHIPAKKLIRNIKILNFKMRMGTPTEFVLAIPRRIRKIVKKLV